jgi:hypothetical protein
MDGQEGAKLDEARLLGAKSGNRGLNLGLAAYRHGSRLDSQRSGGGVERSQELFSTAGRVVGIEHERGTFDAGRDLLQQTEPLAAHGGLDVCETRNVTTGACQARDEARGVADDRKHDRDGTGLSVQRCRYRRGRAEDDVGLRPDQLRRESTRAVGISVCPPLLEPRVAAIGPTQSCQFLHECGKKGARIALGRPHQYANTADLCGLLRGCDAQRK